MSSVDVSIVVCTYNRPKRLAQALESLLVQRTDDRLTYEIVVVDDGSTDTTGEVLAEFVGRNGPVPTRCVRTDGVGVDEARNAGVRAANGEWIALAIHTRH